MVAGKWTCFEKGESIFFIKHIVLKNFAIYIFYMAWQTSIKAATYTTPSGKEFSFGYDSQLSSETDLKTATFTFPERDGALVVPLGLGGRKFSFSCYFYGNSCIDDANDFEEGLKERGYGELQHPLYGTHKVVPTGTIKRSDDVVAGLNISQVDVTFAETLTDTAVINSEVVTVDEINNKVDEFKEKSVWEYVKDAAFATVKAAIWCANKVKKAIRAVNDALSTIAKTEKSIYTAFQSVQNEIYAMVDSLAANLESIAYSTVALINLPADCVVTASTKIENYVAAVDSIINSFKIVPANYENAKNQWATTRLMLESLGVSCSSGVAISASKVISSSDDSSNSSSEAGFKSREEAVNAASSILDLYEKIKAFEESNIGKDYFVETGEGFSAMFDIITLSVKSIIDSSFSLPTKKIIVLDRDRQVTELVMELYGSLDRLDEFILDNALTYSEIELIPMGREVCYYE